MFDLCIVQTEVSYPYDGPFLRLPPILFAFDMMVSPTEILTHRARTARAQPELQQPARPRLKVAL